jgi:2-polyprenyl-3-methyl-5-hydroxy-6-metoxy-1,4-benzoquinol methylase
MVHSTVDSVEAIRRWDVHARAMWAEIDPQDGDPHRVILLNPTLFRLLPDVQGKCVLDAGCGEGYFCRKLARRGARVTGVDFSREMLRLAEERTDPGQEIEYLHENCETLEGLATGSFEVVVSNMVLMDLPDYRAALKSFYRVLALEGVLVFSISHPCFATPVHGWVRDEAGNRLYWKMDQYFSEGAYEQSFFPGEGADQPLLFHRTLSSYLNALLEMGFELQAVVEPEPSQEMLARYPGFAHHLRMSHFIVFKARKT